MLARRQKSKACWSEQAKYVSDFRLFCLVNLLQVTCIFNQTANNVKRNFHIFVIWTLQWKHNVPIVHCACKELLCYWAPRPHTLGFFAQCNDHPCHKFQSSPQTPSKHFGVTFWMHIACHNYQFFSSSEIASQSSLTAVTDIDNGACLSLNLGVCFNSIPTSQSITEIITSIFNYCSSMPRPLVSIDHIHLDVSFCVGFLYVSSYRQSILSYPPVRALHRIGC